MKTPTLLAALCYLSTLSLAAGVPRDLSTAPISSLFSVEKRQQIDNYYIHLYENSNYLGRGVDLQAAWGICQSIIQENDDWASSAKADAGGNCLLYPDHKCVGTPLAVGSAGVADFSPLGFDNRVSAFRCGA